MWYGISTYLAILPLLFALLALVVYVAGRFAYEPPQHPLVNIFLQEKNVSNSMVWISLLLACVIGPAVEEVFFRGFFYMAIRKYWGTGWAAVLSAGLFAAVHENLFSFIPIFFLGMVLCYLYERRKSLISCITLHILHNSAFIMYFFLMKDILSSMARS
jgi:membrane protease YdiL (CAAX protease family)